jgi:hypothetical protein
MSKTITQKEFRERANDLFKKMIVETIEEDVEREITSGVVPATERVFVRLSGYFHRPIKRRSKCPTKRMA